METTLSRRDRERIQRRDEMLAAARSVFAEKGYENATVDEIAQRAEYGKGTLYNYFPGGKEDILFAILDNVYNEFEDIITASFESVVLTRQNARSAFGNFLLNCFRFYADREDLFMILMNEAHRMVLADDEEKAAYFFRQRDRIVSALSDPISRTMDAGAFRPFPPTAVAHMIMGNINGCQMHACLAGRSDGALPSHFDTPEARANFLTTFLFDGLLASTPVVQTT